METVKLFSSRTLQDFVEVDSALEGNQQAYRTLFKRYWKQLLFTVGKMIPDQEEARDITMEAFSKAFTNLHRFNKDYGFNTWLFRVAINHSLDYLRRKRLPTTPLSVYATEDATDCFVWGNDQDGYHQNPEEQIMQWQKMIVIQGHLHALPPDLRDIARMRFVEAYSYKEIASSLQMPMGTIKARIHRARCLLQQKLKPWCKHT
jgi:RNA polymerase sigma-70 factor (ECF subfamily)